MFNTTSTEATPPIQHQTMPPPETDRAQTTDAANTTPNAKRKFKWVLGSEGSAGDQYNQRGPDGSLLPLKTLPPLPAGLGQGADKEGDILDDELVEIYEAMLAINGQPCYDAEMNALGALDPSLWMLMPANLEPAIAPPKSVLKGSRVFPVDIAMRAGIYHLAKNQLTDKSEDVKMKWAALRLEMYKAGWFDNQKMVRRMTLPAGYVSTIESDWNNLKVHMPHAWKLCSFVPFLIEHSFRSYSVGYTASSKNEFLARAKKLTRSSRMEEVHNFLEADILYGQAFRWIGVKRPREVLMAQLNDPNIPNVFRVRANSAPAGQALITSTYAVLQSLASANWWMPIKTAGNFEDSAIRIVNAKIAADPCKYHILGLAYGSPVLTPTEIQEVEEAKRQAIMLAPILQAYCDTIVVDSDMGKVKALRKSSDSNRVLYLRAKDLFTRAKRQRTKNVADPFMESLFNPDYSRARIALATTTGAKLPSASSK